MSLQGRTEVLNNTGGEEAVWFGSLRVTSLFFTDDVVLLTFSSQLSVKQLLQI